MPKRKTKMERELEVQDSARLRKKRKSWAEEARESKRIVKSEGQALATFSNGVRLIDKILARRRKTRVKA